MYDTSQHNLDENKVQAIESMLDELEMSKEELNELIKQIMEASIGEEREVSNDVRAEHDVSIEELGNLVANGDFAEAAKFLSEKELQNISIRVGFAHSLMRAKGLGISISYQQLAKELGLEEDIGEIYPNGDSDMLGDKKNHTVPKVSLAGIASKILKLISGSGNELANNAAAKNFLDQLMNDPNSLSNPNSSLNVFKKSIHQLRMKVANAVDQVDEATIKAQNNRVERLAERAEKANFNVNKIKNSLKDLLTNVNDLKQGKDGEWLAEVDGIDELVPLKDLIDDLNILFKPKANYLLNKLSSEASELQKDLLELGKELPGIDSFQFTSDSKIQVVIESENNLKSVNVRDYLQDVAKFRKDQQKDKISGEEADIERAKGKVKGPELEYSLEEARKIEEDYKELMDKMGLESDEPSAELDVKKKDIKDNSKNLAVKADIISDKMQLLEQIKGGDDMKSIEGSMKGVMKDMKEAMQNKDLVNDMKQQLAKDRELDK